MRRNIKTTYLSWLCRVSDLQGDSFSFREKEDKVLNTPLLLELGKCHRALHPDGMKRLSIIFLLITCSLAELLGGVLISILLWSTASKCKRAAVITACGEETTEELELQGNTLPKDLSAELAGRRQSRKLQGALSVAAESRQIRGVAYIKALVLQHHRNIISFLLASLSIVEENQAVISLWGVPFTCYHTSELQQIFTACLASLGSPDPQLAHSGGCRLYCPRQLGCPQPPSPAALRFSHKDSVPARRAAQCYLPFVHKVVGQH